MKNLLHSIIHPAPPPPDIQAEADRIEGMLREARIEHSAALTRANDAFRDTVRLTERFIEGERRQ